MSDDSKRPDLQPQSSPDPQVGEAHQSIPSLTAPNAGQPATAAAADGVTDPTTTPDEEAKAEAAAPQERPNSVGRAVREFVRESVIVVGTALLISLIIKTFIFQMFFIPSESMESTLIEGDRVVVSQLTPGLFDLKRGDVVVFEDPSNWLSGQVVQEPPALKKAVLSALTFVGILPQKAGKHLIKRVVGMPGDTVKCCDANGSLTVNGKAISEPNVKKGESPSDIPFEVTVPQDRLWVMGDNRGHSKDSRWNTTDQYGGAVPMEAVVGRATMIAWPMSRWTWLGNYPEAYQEVPEPQGQGPK